MPKRKIKGEVTKKKIGKKQLLILPMVIGASVLVGLGITHFFPPPNISSVCLKSPHNMDSYNVYPRVQVFIDGKQYLLPDNIGRFIENGKACMRPIHTDSVGDMIHIQYIRPVQLSFPDLMKVYTINNKTLHVIDNSTGNLVNKTINLSNFNIVYSYYSDKNKFLKIENSTSFPSFSNSFLGRINLTEK